MSLLPARHQHLPGAGALGAPLWAWSPSTVEVACARGGGSWGSSLLGGSAAGPGALACVSQGVGRSGPRCARVAPGAPTGPVAFAVDPLQAADVTLAPLDARGGHEGAVRCGARRRWGSPDARRATLSVLGAAAVVRAAEASRALGVRPSYRRAAVASLAAALALAAGPGALPRSAALVAEGIAATTALLRSALHGLSLVLALATAIVGAAGGGAAGAVVGLLVLGAGWQLATAVLRSARLTLNAVSGAANALASLTAAMGLWGRVRHGAPAAAEGLVAVLIAVAGLALVAWGAPGPEAAAGGVLVCLTVGAAAGRARGVADADGDDAGGVAGGSDTALAAAAAADRVAALIAGPDEVVELGAKTSDVARALVARPLAAAAAFLRAAADLGRPDASAPEHLARAALDGAACLAAGWILASTPPASAALAAAAGAARTGWRSLDGPGWGGGGW